MNIHAPARMTVDEFLRWSLEQESGRYELEQGRVVMQQSQNIGHLNTKGRLYDALRAAIRNSAAAVYALPDGATVRIPGERAYEPDALIAPLPMPPETSLEVPNPIAVFEVLSPSPSSIRRDLTSKLRGYGLLSCIQHYVIVDPHERSIFHFRREGAALVATDELTEGTLRLDPPGLEVPVADMLIPVATSQ